MCFSAPASFAAAAFLAPIGVYTLKTALRHDPRYLGFAAFPLLFGVQQLVEGGLWLGIARQDPVQSHALALGFLFFAYFLWPAFVPFSSFLVERGGWRRRAFLALTVCGCLLGLSLFVPLLVHPDWLPVRVVRHSIDYSARLIWDGVAPDVLLRVVYAGIVCGPLLLSSARPVRVFGALIALSVIVGLLFAQYAFTSIWCFMAAILSGHILIVMRQVARR